MFSPLLRMFYASVVNSNPRMKAYDICSVQRCLIAGIPLKVRPRALMRMGFSSVFFLVYFVPNGPCPRKGVSRCICFGVRRSQRQHRWQRRAARRSASPCRVPEAVAQFPYAGSGKRHNCFVFSKLSARRCPPMRLLCHLFVIQALLKSFLIGGGPVLVLPFFSALSA